MMDTPLDLDAVVWRQPLLEEAPARPSLEIERPTCRSETWFRESEHPRWLRSRRSFHMKSCNLKVARLNGGGRDLLLAARCRDHDILRHGKGR